MANRKVAWLAIGGIAIAVAAIFIAMRVADVGVFASDTSVTATTTTTTTAAPPVTSGDAIALPGQSITIGANSPVTNPNATVAPTTSAASTTTPVPTAKSQDFSPTGIASKAYFSTLLASIQLAQAQVKRQEAAVQNNPTVSNQTLLIGVQQNCMAVVSQYNATAATISTKTLRSANLPAQVDSNACSP